MDLTDPATGKVLFTVAELACKGSGQVRLATGFAEKLVLLRLSWGRPMRLTSACRSSQHNAAVGGHPRSLHICDQPAHGLDGAAAVDVAVADITQAWELDFIAKGLGWSVGVPKAGFLHLDRRDLAGLPRGLFGYGG